MALFIAAAAGFLFFNLRRELDRELADQIESVEQGLSFGPDGKLEVGQASDHTDPDRTAEPYLEIRELDGALLYRNHSLAGAQLDGMPTPGEGAYGYSPRSSALPDGTRIRLASRVDFVESHPVLIRLASSEERLWNDIRESAWAVLAAFPIVLVIAGFVAFGLAKRFLAPLGAMAARAEEITAERLNERLPVENPDDELGHLARIFNNTLARLEQSFERLRRFTADASHELRTPLTAIRSVGWVGMQKDGDAQHYREIIGSMLEEANRLTSMVENLLTISRADAGHVQLECSPLRLRDLARDAAALLEDLADEKAQHLTVEGDDSAVVLADRLILRHAVMNVIDNAVKYSPVGGSVRVRVERQSDRCFLDVIDSGPGIPPEHRDKVFDRFYRVDKARSRDAGGSGLGLSIARWAVEAHGGSIELFSETDRGSTFRITLPAIDVSRAPGTSSMPEKEVVES
ncbi:MAG TPA: ATP-binding protein [Terriglobales bacterium]|nr:ATP-binding protein [Terriglobales bacterium]